MAGRVKLEFMVSMNYPAGQQEKYRPTPRPLASRFQERRAYRLRVSRAAQPLASGFQERPSRRYRTAPAPQLAPYCLTRLLSRIGQVGAFDSAGAPGRRTTRENSLDVCGPPRVPPFQHSKMHIAPPTSCSLKTHIAPATYSSSKMHIDFLLSKDAHRSGDLQLAKDAYRLPAR